MGRIDGKQSILDAVVTVIARDGVEGTNLRSVAIEADVSLGLIGYHFSGKQAVITATFARAADQWIEAAETASAAPGDPAARVKALLGSPFEMQWLEPDQLTLRLSLWTAARTNPHLAAVDDALTTRYHDLLCSLLTALHPQTPAQHLAEISADVMTIQAGIFVHWSRANDRRGVDRGIERCLRIALRPPQVEGTVGLSSYG